MGFCEALVTSSLIADWELAQLISETFQLPFMPIELLTPNPAAQEEIDKDFFIQHNLVLVDVFGQILTVAMPGLVPAEILAQIAAQTDSEILPLVGSVESNRRWVSENLEARVAPEREADGDPSSTRQTPRYSPGWRRPGAAISPGRSRWSLATPSTWALSKLRRRAPSSSRRCPDSGTPAPGARTGAKAPANHRPAVARARGRPAAARGSTGSPVAATSSGARPLGPGAPIEREDLVCHFAGGPRLVEVGVGKPLWVQLVLEEARCREGRVQRADSDVFLGPLHAQGLADGAHGGLAGRIPRLARNPAATNHARDVDHDRRWPRASSG